MASMDELKQDMSGLAAGWWRDLRLAGQFLTRLPIPHDRDGEFENPMSALSTLAPASRTFPLIGVAVGGLAGVVLMLAAALGLPPLAWALTAVGVMVLITGGLHEDGLADTLDGFGGGATREDKLAIMADSRTGAYGVLALVISVGLRAALLAGLDAQVAAATLVAAASFSRAVLPPVMNALDPARAGGLGAAAGRPDDSTAITALLLGAVLVVIFAGFGAGLAAVLAGAFAAFAFSLLARAQIGGHTGDVLGAVQQVTEIACLVAVVVVIS